MMCENLPAVTNHSQPWKIRKADVVGHHTQKKPKQKPPPVRGGQGFVAQDDPSGRGTASTPSLEAQHGGFTASPTGMRMI